MTTLIVTAVVITATLVWYFRKIWTPIAKYFDQQLQLHQQKAIETFRQDILALGEDYFHDPSLKQPDWPKTPGQWVFVKNSPTSVIAYSWRYIAIDRVCISDMRCKCECGKERNVNVASWKKSGFGIVMDATDRRAKDFVPKGPQDCPECSMKKKKEQENKIPLVNLTDEQDWDHTCLMCMDAEAEYGLSSCAHLHLNDSGPIATMCAKCARKMIKGKGIFQGNPQLAGCPLRTICQTKITPGVRVVNIKKLR